MTTLTLTSITLAPASDPSDILTLAQYAETGDIVADGVSVRRYAGGVDRLVVAPGRSTPVKVSFRYMSRATYQSLAELVGTLVLFRDQRGRAVWGVIGALSATEWIASDALEDVSFELRSVTYSEIV